jgi:hypothetical protein
MPAVASIANAPQKGYARRRSHHVCTPGLGADGPKHAEEYERGCRDDWHEIGEGGDDDHQQGHGRARGECCRGGECCLHWPGGCNLRYSKLVAGMCSQGILGHQLLRDLLRQLRLQPPFDVDVGKFLALEPDIPRALCVRVPGPPARCRTASLLKRTRRPPLTWHPQRARQPRQSGCRFGVLMPRPRRRSSLRSRRCHHWLRARLLSASQCARPDDLPDAICSWVQRTSLVCFQQPPTSEIDLAQPTSTMRVIYCRKPNTSRGAYACNSGTHKTTMGWLRLASTG